VPLKAFQMLVKNIDVLAKYIDDESVKMAE
jgi:hypothetical protein